MSNGTLVNLGDLSKPATVLIEKISDAVGAVFEPYQIKRLARAEAEAEKIKAIAHIELTEIQQRAMIRMVQEEGKKQENIESISAKAIGDLQADAKPENVENDWLATFFDKCKLVSDKEMQGVWGRILAGEANRPGTFSKRTIELISTLDKADAHLFTALCGFGWMIGNIVPLIFDFEHDIYTKHGINFSALTHLESLGLLRFEAQFGFIRKGLPKSFGVLYYGTPISLVFDKGTEKDNQLQTGKILLSQAGQELAPISGSRPVDGFIEYVSQQWAEQNVATASSWPNMRFKPTA